MADGSGVKVTITYCAECGYEPQTLALTETLMKTFTHQLTAFELVPWYERQFDVGVYGKLVPSAAGEGAAQRLPRPGRPREAWRRTRPCGRHASRQCRPGQGRRVPGAGRGDARSATRPSSRRARVARLALRAGRSRGRFGARWHRCA